MKNAKKKQSFSFTRLNQLSSRRSAAAAANSAQPQHLLHPDPQSGRRRSSVGSVRRYRTHNTGERLKEAGNINSSLLTLRKCINAMRLNEHAKNDNTVFQHHIPFRESKLTHFLQFFFSGASRVSMVVNINQNSSCFGRDAQRPHPEAALYNTGNELSRPADDQYRW
ncbi:kinesin-like protein KIF20B [Siniperca chuatsi]|uniref:kinesin-like protein KIF20B n=1 Tax=Siniperca chuatsi TaxID=119488 RepID=UPI001CE0DEB5|nr:kinesin-like protein KIF20B [Siniperca chuatsi]